MRLDVLEVLALVELLCSLAHLLLLCLLCKHKTKVVTANDKSMSESIKIPFFCDIQSRVAAPIEVTGYTQLHWLVQRLH